MQKSLLLEKAMVKIEEGNTAILSKMLGIFYKDFHEDYKESNFYNDDPYVEEEEEDEEDYDEQEYEEEGEEEEL